MSFVIFEGLNFLYFVSLYNILHLHEQVEEVILVLVYAIRSIHDSDVVDLLNTMTKHNGLCAKGILELPFIVA